jgi:outer membrane protein OmpA-like peptidoglycan-associated protein/opacity protein-like surface antigen
MKRLLTLCTLLAVLATATVAQPSVPLRLGAHLGLNYNMAGAGYAEWGMPQTSRPFGYYGNFVESNTVDGSGLGIYGGLNAQWMLLQSLGLQVRLSYDQRSMLLTDDVSYTRLDGTPYSDDFDFNIGLLNAEALIKLYMGRQFHFTGGLGLGYLMTKTYDYTADGESTVADKEIEGASFAPSVVFGLGYDIYLSDAKAKQQWILTPFAELSYVMNMRGDLISDDQSDLDDGLSIPTIRAGFGIAFGDATQEQAAAPVTPGFNFFTTVPEGGIATDAIVDERLPILPYVFFEKGNTEIPSRYTKLTATETATFPKKQMDALTGSEAEEFVQGEVYYHIMNIIGARMRQTPSYTLKLIGSDPVEKNGQDLANSVKKYLVDVWGIDAGRIDAVGQENPRIPSGTDRTPPADRPLTIEENRRVEFVANDPTLLKQAQIKVSRKATIENDVLITLKSDAPVSSWTANFTAANGMKYSYGPYTGTQQYIDPMQMIPEGTSSIEYTCEVIAKMNDGSTRSASSPVELERRSSAARSSNYSLLFEYAEEDPIGRRKSFLQGTVASEIQDNSYVRVTGSTDNIGTEEANMNISIGRATEVRDILRDAFASQGKRGISVEAEGTGESRTEHTYPNNLPEGRMYNRSVTIHTMPK